MCRSLTLIVVWYSVVAQSVYKAITRSESRKRAYFWTALRLFLGLVAVFQLATNIAVATMRHDTSTALDFALLAQVCVRGI
jgi:uncharacterized membrane protein YhaH (DUF805 family)